MAHAQLWLYYEKGIFADTNVEIEELRIKADRYKRRNTING